MMADLFNLDFSILGDNISSTVDVDSVTVKVISTVGEILSSVFDSAERQKIVPVPRYAPTRLNFCCPYCGDSAHNPRKKRGNLYLSNLFYRCYNTGCKSDRLPFIRMVDDFDKRDNFESPEITYLSTRRDDNTSFGSGAGGGSFVSHLKDIDDFALNRDYFMSLFSLIEAKNDDFCREYLTNRKQINLDQSMFAYSQHTKSLFIMNMSKKGDKVIGCQERHLRAKKNEQRFTSHNYSDIVKNWMMLDDPDPDVLEKMDRYGLIYNVLRIDMNRDVPVLEGAIDANHLSNSAATLSASNKIYLKNGLYLFDNTRIDAAGRVRTLEMLASGYRVFLWGKFLRDYPQFEYCKDINDIIKKEESFPINEVMMDYFTDDKLDGIYI
jgi:hypothetical protein